MPEDNPRADVSPRAAVARRITALRQERGLSLTALAASEVLDQGTCGPCLLADGREYPSLTVALAEYPAGGYEVSVAFCEPDIDDILTAGMREILS